MIRILVADDHALIRKGIKEILLDEYPGAVVVEVIDAESLLKAARDDEWDIIITDLTMPGRNGLEALRDLKQLYPKLPVLVLSMHAEDHYALRVIKAGASGYIMKNSATEELITAVKRALLGRKYITSSIAELLAASIDINSNPSPHELLSDREFEVFKLIATGKSIAEISNILFLGPTTISTYRSRILIKMGIKTNAELIQYALENKIA